MPGTHTHAKYYIIECYSNSIEQALVSLTCHVRSTVKSIFLLAGLTDCLLDKLSLTWVKAVQLRVFDKNFYSAPNWLKSYISTVPQETMMGQTYSILIERLNHVAPKWSNRSSKVGHLVFSLGHLLGHLLGQWCAIVAYQTPWFNRKPTRQQIH